jgi:hypothetical protein
MNERIRELMNQSMESTGVEGLGGSYMELNPEKFAKLVVQECIYVLEKNISPLQMKSFVDEYPERIPMSSKELQDRRRNGQIEGLLLGATAIEEHFGVKE